MSKNTRGDRLIKERFHDPYMSDSNPREPTLCTDCGVVFARGHWQWVPSPPENPEHDLCPACRRTRDRVPAGMLSLSGEFFAQHRGEIMRLVQNKVESQMRQHPMKRIMGIEEQDDGATVITFTDYHLPRGVGEAVRSAYEGELEIKYTEEAQLVRATWSR